MTGIEQLLNPTITPLSLSDTINHALDLMEELMVEELPLVEEGQFKGFYTETQLLGANDSRILLSQYPKPEIFPILGLDAHIFDVFGMCALHGINMVALLDDDNNYQGAITLKDAAAAFAQSYSITVKGGMLLIKMYDRDYSMAQISRLVEAEGVRIIASYIEPDKNDVSKILVFMKFNQEDLSRIVATLERFEFNIVRKFFTTQYPSLEKERLDSLLRFLNV